MCRGRKMNRLAGVSHQPLWTVTPDWVNNGNVRRCVRGWRLSAERRRIVAVSAHPVKVWPLRPQNLTRRTSVSVSIHHICWFTEGKGKSSRTLLPDSPSIFDRFHYFFGPYCTPVHAVPTFCCLRKGPRWSNLAAGQRSRMRWGMTFVWILLPVAQISREPLQDQTRQVVDAGSYSGGGGLGVWRVWQCDFCADSSNWLSFLVLTEQLLW